MQVNFFDQPFMLYASEINKVHGSVHDYLVLVLDDPQIEWDELVMTGKLKKISYGLLTDIEVFPQ